ncbi:MAG: DUF488 family protein [Gammaproteobacteria bacterium]
MKKPTQLVTFYRQKVLLALLQSFGGKLRNIEFQKYLFLFTHLCQREKSYEFVPFKYGCFSFQSYADRRRLVEIGAITGDPDHWVLESGDDYVKMLDEGDRKKLGIFKLKYAALRGEDLIREIYTKFPYYAINSEIAATLLTPAQLEKIAEARPVKTDHRFFTIGYEGKSLERYLNLLICNSVKVLCDVRKNPLSRKYGFSKSTLADTLPKLGIEYMHMPQLGIESDKRQDLVTRRDYDRLFDEYEATTLRSNTQAVTELLKLVDDNKRVAITCFEAEHCMCHRGRVANALAKQPQWNYEITHL